MPNFSFLTSINLLAEMYEMYEILQREETLRTPEEFSRDRSLGRSYGG